MITRPTRKPVALLTGAAGGLGRALARELADRSFIVAVSDIDAQGAQDVAREIGQPDNGCGVDVRDVGQVTRWVDSMAGTHGGVDLMFNNAGVGIVGEAGAISPAQWRQVIEVNLMGVVHGTHAAWQHMKKQGSGRIVNIGSLASLIGFPTAAPYATSKHALVGLDASLAREAPRYGFGLSLAYLGFLDTGIYEASPAIGVPREAVRSLVPVPLRQPRAAARHVVRGVLRERRRIFFPHYVRIVWWLQRLHPATMVPFQALAMRRFRAAQG